jgi:hypothetical protein
MQFLFDVKKIAFFFQNYKLIIEKIGLLKTLLIDIKIVIVDNK